MRMRDTAQVPTAIRRQLDIDAIRQITKVSCNYKQKGELIVKAPFNILAVPL